MLNAGRPRTFAQLFMIAGSVLAVLGVTPWLVFISGGADAHSPALLVLAGGAVVGGIFVALMGLGLVRRLDALERAADERRLDAAVLTATAAAAAATADSSDPAAADCGESCSTCTASCALHALRG